MLIFILIQVQVKLVLKNTKIAFTCGKCSSQTHWSGGTIEDESQIQIIQILSTRILVKLSGSIPVILHGLKNNFNCTILGWQHKASDKMCVLVLVCRCGFLMTRKKYGASVFKG